MNTIRRMLVPVVCGATLVLTGCGQLGTQGASGQSTVTVTVEASPEEQAGGQQAAQTPQADNAPATPPAEQGEDNSAADTRKKRSHKDRYENMLLPPGAEPANDAAINGWYNVGRYQSLYVGNTNTSIPFANEIHNTWLAHADPNKSPNSPITFKAWSEVTQSNFEVTCEDGPKYVTCRGGYNALVYIV